MSKLNTRKIRKFKKKNSSEFLEMLTCYDYQTAALLNQTAVDMILVGDSLGNVILGHETTISVTLEEMILFGKAVRKGASHKFLVVDMPFGSTRDMSTALEHAVTLFRQTQAEALKIEGAWNYLLEIIERLTQCGIPVMGHIGLTPQSVHEQGGYYTHGKDPSSASSLLEQAKKLEKAGCFSVLLECVDHEVTKNITDELHVPTIGIGSGEQVDGRVLVINDLFKMGPGKVPRFCEPLTDLYSERIRLLDGYFSKPAPKRNPTEDSAQYLQ